MQNTDSNAVTDKVLSEDQCQDIVERASKFIRGGGDLALSITSGWRGNTRWARNEIISSGDSRSNSILLNRTIKSAHFALEISNFSNEELKRAIEICERRLQINDEFQEMPPFPSRIPEPVKPPPPKVWFESVLNLEEDERADIYFDLIRGAEQQGLLSAGYLQANATAINFAHAINKRRSVHVTESQISITVRSPDGLGSGWAGLNWNDWDRIDGHKIASTALEKCIMSKNPVAIEPGRYMVVLEPQATHDIVNSLFRERIMSRPDAEHERRGTIYTLSPGYSKIGLRIFDSRLKVSVDPYHPDATFFPGGDGDFIRPTTWIENGVLKDLNYNTGYAIQKLGINQGKIGTDSYTLEGVGPGTNSSLEQMIANTDRGLLVTRFDIDVPPNSGTMLTTGLTRDGLWLIEKGKVSKSVKNLRFTESPMYMLNNVLEYGVPTRVFAPGRSVRVPALRAQDFSFTSTVDAI